MAEASFGIGFWTFGVTDARLTASSGVFDLLGINPAGVQLDLRFLETLVHPADRLVAEDLTTLAMDPRQADRQFRLIRPDGRLRHLHSRASTVFDRSGNPVRVVAALADVSDRQRRQLRGEGLEALLHTVAKLFNAALWIADEDGRLVERFVAGDLAGLDGASTAADWRSLIHPDDAARVPALWKDAVASGGPFRFQGRLKAEGGDYRGLHAAGVPFQTQNASERRWGGYVVSSFPQGGSTNTHATSELLLTPGQVRACRALLGWTAESLAARAGISVSTVRRMEGAEVSQGQGESMRLVLSAFRDAGLKIWLGTDGKFCLSEMG